MGGLGYPKSPGWAIIDTARLCRVLKKMQSYMAPLGFNSILSSYSPKDQYEKYN